MEKCEIVDANIMNQVLVVVVAAKKTCSNVRLLRRALYPLWEGCKKMMRKCLFRNPSRKTYQQVVRPWLVGINNRG